MTGLLCLVFFLSGASALIFEILWFRLAGLAFGNSVWAASIVLSSFMGGLALGNAFMAARGDRIERPVRYYAALEIVIGISGILLVLLFPNLTTVLRPVFAPLLDHPALLNAVRTLFAFLLLLIPTAAMGATLPILAKAINRRLRNFGQVLGFLYGTNTLGAVLGVLCAEAFLIERFGLVTTGLVATALNLLAAAVAFGISKTFDQESGLGPSNPPLQKRRKDADGRGSQAVSTPALGLLTRTKGLLAAGFLSGFALLALEVIWFRFLILFFNAFPLNLAVILAIVLAAISLGGFIASRWLQRHGAITLVVLFALSAVAIVLTYAKLYDFYTAPRIYNEASEIRRLLYVSLFLVFPISLSSGMIFTLLGRLLHTEVGGETKTAGLLTLFNTLGGMCGSFLAGFVLVPFLGTERSFLLVALIYAATIVFVIGVAKDASKSEKRWRFLPVPLVVLILFLFPYNTMQRYLDLPVAFYRAVRGEVRVAAREGFNETVQFLAKRFLNRPRYFRLVTNGHSMSSTMAASKRYMQTFVYLPVALHPRPEKAALICFGCGMTAKALTDTKHLKSIDIVDISKDIVAMSTNIFPEPASNPIHDPRVRLRIEDGRFFLGTTTEKFDLITGEPPPPTFRGVVNLYTQEYFQLLRDRLADGGVVTYWLPVDMVTPDGAHSILKAFFNVFPNGTLWSASGWNWMMVGIKEPFPPASKADFTTQWQDAAHQTELRALGLEKPELLGAMFIGDAKRVAEWIGASPPAIDDFPARVYGGFEAVKQKEYLAYFQRFLDRPAMAASFRQSPEIAKIWPSDLVDRTTPYFAQAQGTILDYPTNSIDSMRTLHRYLADPRSTDYDLYALLDSDEYAQRILTDTLAENRQAPQTILSVLRDNLAQAAQSGDRRDADNILEISNQLAARAIVSRDFLLAEKYYDLLSSVAAGRMKTDCGMMRALLFHSAKEPQQANEVLRRLRPGLSGSEAAELDRFEDWLRTAFAP